MSIAQTDIKVKQVIGRITEVAVLPQVVYKVIEMTGDTTATARDIDKVLSVDPGLTTKVLTLANSAYFALPRQVTSIKEAVVFLGFKAIRQLAMTAGCFELFVGKRDKDSMRHRTWWRHAIDTANCARVLAPFSKTVLAEEAYAAALLHDIGQSLLSRYGGDDYSKVDELILCGISEIDAEISVYGCDHTMVGTAATQHWRFPKALIEAISGHHNNEETFGDDKLTAIVTISDYLAEYFTNNKPSEEPDPNAAAHIPPFLKEKLDIGDEKFNAAVDACRIDLANGNALSGLF